LEFGLIGNCQFNALVDRKGSVCWLCWPRFDSSFVFGSLLDKEKGGSFQISPYEADISGDQVYLENSNILKTTFHTPKGDFEIIDFAPRFSQFNRYYKPTTLVRIVRPIRGEPIVKVSCQPTSEYGLKNLGATCGSNHIEYEGAPAKMRLTTNASLTMVAEEKPFLLTKTLYFCLTWGRPLESELERTCEDFLDKTLAYWQRWVKHCHIPREYQEAVIRSALVLKLHQYEDTGAIIAATTTSIPEAMGTSRNWDYRYCWLRDALFSLVALQRLTQFEEMEKFAIYLKNLVELKIDHLQPVYSVSGDGRLTEVVLDHLSGYLGHKPVRIGNQAHEHLQHDVYGEMILAIGQLFLDRRFGSDGYGSRELLQNLLNQIERHLEDEDAGLWEFRGAMQMHTFTVLMHWAGAKKALEIAEENHYHDMVKQAASLKKRSEEILNRDCFDKELGVFTQAAGKKEMDAALLMLINLGYLKKGDPLAAKQVESIEHSLRTQKNGLIHRYIHTDDFGSTENAFTICNFWLAEAYAHIGQYDKARELFEKLLTYSNHLGLFSEDIDPNTCEQWGNFPQTYSHVGLINAAIAISKPWEV
jgi:GH15 family glucan-1,4-alpha-glucosidase